MLRPWNKSAQLIIEKAQVRSRLSSPSAIAEKVRPVIATEEAMRPYAGLANAIHGALSDLAENVPSTVRAVDIEMDDSFVYYDVVKLDARTLPAAELNQLAGAVLADTIGVAPGDLIVRCSMQSSGASVLVCGMPAAFFQTVEEGVSGTRFQLRRLEPAFALFINRARNLVKQRDVVVVRLHNDFLMLGLLHGAQWEAFSAEHFYHAGWEGLQDRCEAFCSRSCVSGAHQFPVMFSANIGDVPANASQRWNPICDFANTL